MSSRPRRWMRWVFAGFFVVVVAFASIVMALVRGSGPPAPPPIPDPNGYDLLVDAGLMIEGTPPNEGQIDEADPDALRVWVLANQKALELADEGLELPSGVPLSFTQDDADMRDLGALRMLARLMLAEAIVAQEEGRIDAAADRCLAILRLSRNGTRNGLLIHVLVGFAIEGTGRERLQLLRDGLDEDQCRAIARAVMAFENQRADIEETIALETAWGLETAPRGLKLARTFIPGVRGKLDGLLIPALESARNASLRASTLTRLLAIDLAIRAYQVRQNAPPDRVDQLVPDFLDTVPTDPFTDGPFVYRTTEEEPGFVLYSVGPDGKDDGGTPHQPGVDWTTTPGDVVLAPPSP
ncbi:hypothetical protein [Tautonia marina]|uniref:hypothetical protein n=1 Tax=Tautonia marina TaxID=2653855 RepID=UPI001260AC7C|nr:hypothetical protein [Tautonia marina]